MAYKNVYQKLGHRMSEEFQLLAEEKWIIETLTKIKNQRNCLQIERLHLESMKARVKSTNRSDSKCSTIQGDPVASTSTVNLMHNFTGKSAVEQDDTVEIRLDDATCNEEELNLVVTNPVYNSGINPDFHTEEEDEEEESDDDNMFIDMNMLMNGVFK